MSQRDEWLQIGARAIFDVDKDFHEPSLPNRHFKVAISQYQARAEAVLAALEPLIRADEREQCCRRIQSEVDEANAVWLKPTLADQAFLQGKEAAIAALRAAEEGP